NVASTDLIRAAVVAQLAKPAVQPTRWALLTKGFKYEILTWVGIVGGALTLFGNLDAVLKLADWARLLVQNYGLGHQRSSRRSQTSTDHLTGLRFALLGAKMLPRCHHGRVKRTGDGSIVEFRSVVDAVRCGIELQNGMIERNASCCPSAAFEHCLRLVQI